MSKWLSQFGLVTVFLLALNVSYASCKFPWLNCGSKCTPATCTLTEQDKNLLHQQEKVKRACSGMSPCECYKQRPQEVSQILGLDKDTEDQVRQECDQQAKASTQISSDSRPGYGF